MGIKKNACIIYYQDYANSLTNNHDKRHICQKGIYQKRYFWANINIVMKAKEKIQDGKVFLSQVVQRLILHASKLYASLLIFR